MLVIIVEDGPTQAMTNPNVLRRNRRRRKGASATTRCAEKYILTLYLASTYPHAHTAKITPLLLSSVYNNPMPAPTHQQLCLAES